MRRHDARALALAALLATSSVHSAGGPLVSKVTGSATITRAGTGATEPARAGSRLAPGDTLKPGEGATVDILVDGQVQKIVAGAEFRVPETGEDRLFMQSVLGRLAGVATDPGDPAVSEALRAVRGAVVLIAPYDSALPGPLPAVRWRAIAGVQTYDVQVRDSLGVTLLKKSVSETQLDLVAAGFQPQPAVRYTWIVGPGGGFQIGGRTPAPSEAWFELLTPKDAATLKRRLDLIDQAMRGKEPEAKLLLSQALASEQSRCYDLARELMKLAAKAQPDGEWGKLARRRLTGH